MTASPVPMPRSRLRRLKDPVLVTRRLALVLPDPRRGAEVVALMRDPEIARWTLHIPFPYRPAHARAWLKRAEGRRRAGTDLVVQVVRRADGRLVGGMGLHHFDPAHGRAEVGYWIGKEFRRQGYAAEATSALSRFGFRTLGLHRLEARVFPGNAASEGVLRSVGFRLEGTLRENVRKGRAFVDEQVFSLLRGDRARRVRGAPGRRAPTTAGPASRRARRSRKA